VTCTVALPCVVCMTSRDRAAQPGCNGQSVDAKDALEGEAVARYGPPLNASRRALNFGRLQFPGNQVTQALCLFAEEAVKAGVRHHISMSALIDLATSPVYLIPIVGKSSESEVKAGLTDENCELLRNLLIVRTEAAGESAAAAQAPSNGASGVDSAEALSSRKRKYQADDGGAQPSKRLAAATTAGSPIAAAAGSPTAAGFLSPATTPGAGSLSLPSRHTPALRSRSNSKDGTGRPRRCC
jgi:hypothetical protein